MTKVIAIDSQENKAPSSGAGGGRGMYGRGRIGDPVSARLAKDAKDMVAALARALHDRALMVPLRHGYGAWRPGGSNTRELRHVVPTSLSVHCFNRTARARLGRTCGVQLN